MRLTENSFLLRFPKSYELDLMVLQQNNPNLKLDLAENHTLKINVRAFELEKYEFFKIQLPQSLNHPEIEFLEIENNDDRLEFDFPYLIYSTGMDAIIGAITLLIASQLVVWTIKTKKGNAYSENTDYKVPDPDNPDEIIWVKADLTYMSYDKLSEDEQETYKKDGIVGFQVPPTVAVEITSNRYQRKPLLWKMRFKWMFLGTDLGIVVCPFRKELYIFEKGNYDYKTQSIFEPVIHPLLEGLIWDFSQKVDKIQ